ncbi:hypothetical protein Tco_0140929 [Tanacetum coccineum]
MIFTWPLIKIEQDELKVLRTPYEILIILRFNKVTIDVHPILLKVSKPLASLTQKNKKWEWAKEQEEAFQALKGNLRNAQILSVSGGSKEFVGYCDASKLRIRLCNHAKRQGRERDNRNDVWLGPTNGKKGQVEIGMVAMYGGRILATYVSIV